MDTNEINHKELVKLLYITAAFSFILSLSQILMDNIINADAVIYLLSASHIQNDDWLSAAKLYNWLFYPYLIAQLSSLTSLSLELSAHILNATLTSITCVTFILIIKDFFGKEKSLVYIAALVILAFPSLNDYRDLIIRDHGYWAFYLLSCYFFLSSFKDPKITPFAALAVTTCIATAFRPEGIVFMLLLPFIIIIRFFLANTSKKSKIYLLISIILITASLTYFIANNQQSTLGFGKIRDINIYLTSHIDTYNSHLKSSQTYLHALDPRGYSADYAPVILTLTLLTILLVEIFFSTTPIFVLLLIIGFFVHSYSNKHTIVKPWLYIVLINLTILIAYLVQKFFLTGRYPIAFSLTLILFLPLTINVLWEKYQSRLVTVIQRRGLQLICIFTLIASLDSLISLGSNKSYLKQAGQWIESSPDLDAQQLYTNNHLIDYYAGSPSGKRIEDTTLKRVIKRLESGKLSKFDTLAIKVSRKETSGPELLKRKIDKKPINVFKNKKGDAVYIFKMQTAANEKSHRT